MSAKLFVSFACVLSLATVASADEPQSKGPARTSITPAGQANLKLRLLEVPTDEPQPKGPARTSTNSEAYALFKLRILDVPADAAAELMKLESDLPTDSGSVLAVFKNTEELNKRIAAIKGLQRVSEPQLMTTPGRVAKIKVGGGEIPIQVPGPGNTTTIGKREFGLLWELSYQPLDDGRIRVESSAEYSEPNMAAAVKVGNQTVPGITSRRTHLEADLRTGETLVVSMTMMPDRANRGKAAKAIATLFLLTPTKVVSTPNK